MLRKIWNVVKAIGAFIEGVVNFVLYLIDSIVSFIKLIPKAISYLTESLGFLPVSVLGLISIIITVLVIKKIIGR